MGKAYLPEGSYDTGKNKDITYEELLSAKQRGDILCFPAQLCDSEHNLYIDLGKIQGIIPKEEGAYSPTNESVKDIAIITRVGKNVCFKVTDIYVENGGITACLSRKAAQLECFENYIQKPYPGDVIDCTVTHIEPFGAFCDIGCGIIALLPVDSISVSRISGPAERFYTGQSIKAIVKSRDESTSRITLSHKELLGTWAQNAQRFEAGQTVMGIIRSVEDYGIFVELSPNLAGLAEYCDGCKIGQRAAVYIKSIIPEKMKVKLVIVSYMDTELPICEPEYFFDGTHMDEWKYSVDGARKVIGTRF